MSTPWNKLYSVQSSQPVAQPYHNMPARKTGSPARPYSRMDAAWPRYSPPGNGSLYERIPCQVSEPEHSTAATHPTRCPRSAGAAGDPTMLTSGTHCARAEESAPNDPIRLRADELVDGEPGSPEPAHSEQALCIADAGGLFGDPQGEPAWEPAAPAMGTEPISSRFTTFKMPRRRARAARHPHTEAVCDSEAQLAAFGDQPSIDPFDVSCADPRARGLLCYKKWWFLRRVGISVRGVMLVGTPIFLRENALRVINRKHSYIIPLDKVDYIRTSDGLDAACGHFDDDPR